MAEALPLIKLSLLAKQILDSIDYLKDNAIQREIGDDLAIRQDKVYGDSIVYSALTMLEDEGLITRHSLPNVRWGAKKRALLTVLGKQYLQAIRNGNIL